MRLGRHVDGLVDAYYGPPELKEQVDAEPLADPQSWSRRATRCSPSSTTAGCATRSIGLRTYAGELAGEEISYSDEVERCYGVRPARRHRCLRGVHERLDELLPGDGTLAERYQAWRRSRIVPAEPSCRRCRTSPPSCAPATGQLVDLPAGEGLVVEGVRDEPWWAFNYYLGGLRSRVVVNLDVPTTCDDVVHLAAHEIYPGHHTEHALKEQLLHPRARASSRSRSSWCRRRRRWSRRASPRPARP